MSSFVLIANGDEKILSTYILPSPINFDVVTFLLIIYMRSARAIYSQITEIDFVYLCKYRIVASTIPSHFEARAGLFRLLMKWIFDPYDKKLIS